MQSPTEQNDLNNALEWLYSTQMFGIKLGLENITRLLREAECFPNSRSKIIQVVGTNGKGSTSSFLESLAQAHGIKTGMFTSPHLIHFSERIRVNGLDISEPDLTQHLFYFKELVEHWDPHPTFFELSLAVAMSHFIQSQCELIILEAGMGGRLDATSAVPKDLALITPIGMDHQNHLGDTLTQIAAEKGAVMRKDTPCISAPQEKEARLELKHIASQTRCSIDFIKAPFSGLKLGLAGEHQAWNAALALEGLTSILGTGNLRYDSVRAGLANVNWRGRFQIIESENSTAVLDCAHNVPAAKALVAQWKNSFGDQKAHLIFGAAKDKNIHAVLQLLLPIVKSAEVYKLQNPRGETTENLKTSINELAPELPCDEITELSQVKTDNLKLVVGSVFLVGEWLETNDHRIT